ncbi:MAG: methyltransferase domain-containing protein [Chitinivibrionales bacterium]|nr:methyltransferase domain-containing protein [Chitinivibrionales bacterium]
MQSTSGFSAHKHRAGAWDTRYASAYHPLTYGIWRFVSYKRRMVHRVAATVHAGDRVLDLGCGKGAYAHWFLTRTSAYIIALDVAFEAVRNIPPPPRGVIVRVCADARKLPFKDEAFKAAYSIDTLGHVADHNAVLGELARTVREQSYVFVHSECADYRSRWPDAMLIELLGKDVLAEQDGHINMQRSAELAHTLARHFSVIDFFSPAGYLGWLLGYPEKYRIAFERAGKYAFCALTAVFAKVKHHPLAGPVLRTVNALTNHVELLTGRRGGGSCFAWCKKTCRK